MEWKWKKIFEWFYVNKIILSSILKHFREISGNVFIDFYFKSVSCQYVPFSQIKINST